MRVTRVDFYGVERGSFLRYSTIIIDGGIVIRGLKLIRRPDATILVAMPQRKRMDDEFEDMVHPANAEARGVIESAVLGAWEKQCPTPKK